MALSRREFLAVGSAGFAAALAPGGFQTKGRRRSAGTWERIASLPGPAQEVYCTVWNETILVAGGLRSPGDSNVDFTTLSATALYDPQEGAWTPGPDLPAPRHHIVLASAGGRAYGFGGFVGESLRNGFQYRDDVYEFDGREWGRVGSMPAPLGETVALSVNDRIHLLTGSLHGSNAPGASRKHLVYDPKADAWSEARPVPTARSSATGAVIDGALYVAGGRVRRNGIQNLGALERYDPNTDSWATLKPCPQPSGGLAGAALGGMLYCFGGEYFDDGGGVYPDTWAYDPAADDWTEAPPMPTPRHGLAGAALDGRIYSIGGNTAAGVGAATTNVVEALRPGS